MHIKAIYFYCLYLNTYKMKLVIDTEDKTVSLYNRDLYKLYDYEDIGDIYLHFINGDCLNYDVV